MLLRVREGVRETLPDKLGEGVRACDAVTVHVLLRVEPCVLLVVCEGDSEALRVVPCETVALCDALCVPLNVARWKALAVCERVTETLPVRS